MAKLAIPTKIKKYPGLVKAWQARYGSYDPKPRKRRRMATGYGTVNKKPFRRGARGGVAWTGGTKPRYDPKPRNYKAKAKKGLAYLEMMIIPLTASIMILQHALHLGFEGTIDRLKNWRPYFNADDLFKEGHYDWTYHHNGMPIKIGLVAGIGLPIVTKIVSGFITIPKEAKMCMRVGAKIGWGLVIGALIDYFLLIPGSIPKTTEKRNPANSSSEKQNPANSSSTLKTADPVSSYYG